MAAFIDFVLYQLPPPPCRVLEVGCGSEGGLVPALAEAGYDVLGIDPKAPAGERFVQARFQESCKLQLGWDAVVAGRVLHHVRPLGGSLDLLAAAAPLLLVDEFARDLVDEPATEWYEGQHRLLAAAGAEPPGPARLDEWRGRHPDLHPHTLLLAELRARWEERALEWVPYLHRWLGGPASETLEQSLVDAGAIPAIGWRWAGLSRHATGATG
ncbi:MAG TPA: methyltransferase domain-containing protein [Gaiellaceae bacterium]|nr:methyltransferase domain-containing protein [Gaiellaceae bacterium]